MNEQRVFFYGRLASATKRDAERAARDAGYKVASTLRDGLDLIVLGEEEPIAQVRARLASEFDERSRYAFESGALELLSETDFFRRALDKLVEETADLASAASRDDSTPLFSTLEASESPSNSSDAPRSSSPVQGAAPQESGYTPAAVAELVGVSVATIRRQYRRGFLAATFERERLPLFSTREALVAKRLAFLSSSGLSEEFIARRFLAFAELDSSRKLGSDVEQGKEFDALRNAQIDVGTVALNTTLSSDGREILYQSARGPVDWRGQLRFDFNAFPTDGSFETPDAPTALSEEEEQIALAERLAAWNAETTAATGRPAFLDLFSGDEEDEKEPIVPNAREPETILEPVSEPREKERGAHKLDLFELCERAWKLERDGYWEEAERAYRQAALDGGHEPIVCYHLGKVLFLLGDYSAARERFYSALELDPLYVDAKIDLGKTFVALGDVDGAQKAFQESLQIRKNDPALRVELGKLYLRQGARQDAEREFRAAAETIDDVKLADDIRRLLLTLV